MRRAAALGHPEAADSAAAGRHVAAANATAAGRADVAARTTPAAPSPLSLHPVTLAFGDARLDAAYARHQEESLIATDKSSHAFHIAVSVLHTGYAAYSATGSLLSPAAAALMLPYILIALAHWRLSRTAAYARHRLALLLVLEAAYAAVCTYSMPRWVLVPATNWKHYVRDFTLGSGVLISAWVTIFCLKPTFWLHYITIPLEHLLQAAVLTPPVCDARTATPYGAAVTARAAAVLDAAAAAGALASPACPPRGGPGAAPGEARDVCVQMLLAWQVMWCASLVYGKFRLERAARLKFAASQGWGPMWDAWPPAPPLVQVLVHLAVYTHVLSALWAWLGCAPGGTGGAAVAVPALPTAAA